MSHGNYLARYHNTAVPARYTAAPGRHLHHSRGSLKVLARLAGSPLQCDRRATQVEGKETSRFLCANGRWRQRRGREREQTKRDDVGWTVDKEREKKKYNRKEMIVGRREEMRYAEELLKIVVILLKSSRDSAHRQDPAAGDTAALHQQYQILSPLTVRTGEGCALVNLGEQLAAGCILYPARLVFGITRTLIDAPSIPPPASVSQAE